MDEATIAAYRALRRASGRVGAAEYAAQRAAHAKARRSPRTLRYSPTDGHRELVQGMADLGRGKISPDEAMSLLHYGESAHALTLARDAQK